MAEEYSSWQSITQLSHSKMEESTTSDAGVVKLNNPCKQVFEVGGISSLQHCIKANGISSIIYFFIFLVLYQKQAGIENQFDSCIYSY